jgi:UDP-glucose 4-epimerase
MEPRIYFVCSHAEPAIHFGAFNEPLKEKFTVLNYSTEPAIEIFNKNVKVIEFNPLGLDLQNEGVQIQLAQEIAKTCSKAQIVITDVGDLFSVHIGQAFAHLETRPKFLCYYENPDDYVPGGYSQTAAEVIKLSDGVLFANVNLIGKQLRQDEHRVIDLGSTPCFGIGYSPTLESCQENWRDNLMCSLGGVLEKINKISKEILVVGGAGFIGSHVNKMLNRAGYRTIILDNLSRGYREAVQQGTFIEGDLADTALLDKIFTFNSIRAVIHLAALMDVGESVKEPAKYYLNNVSHTLNLLHAMVRHGVKTFIFSSTSAIFGNPLTHQFINEEHPCNPISPYGETKLMVEKMLRDFDTAYGLKYCCLRYFNAAGGDSEGKIKNLQMKPSNLIPRILLSLKDSDNSVTIYGNDYSTFDGTCIRDYIHVEDLGKAHILAMEQLFTGSSSKHYNLGSGTGYSVKQVINEVESVLGIKVKIIEGEKRPGDPAYLLADSSKAIRELNWNVHYSLKEMILHACNAYQISSKELEGNGVAN